MRTDATLISELLAAEQTLLTQLKKLLREERVALAARDVDSYADLLARKHDLLTAIDARQADRARQLQDAGWTDVEEGILALSDGEPVLATWHGLRKSVEECQQLNEINARINHRAQQTNAHLLAILRGNSDTPLYDKAGNAADRAATARTGYTA